MVDIYEDLEHFDFSEEINKLRNENEKLQEKVSALEMEKKNLSEKCAALEKQSKKVNENISSLLKTSMAEIQRKDRTINELRQQIDNILYRRAKPNINLPSQSNANLPDNAKYNTVQPQHPLPDKTNFRSDQKITQSEVKREVKNELCLSKTWVTAERSSNSSYSGIKNNAEIDKTEEFYPLVRDRVEERRIKLTQLEFEKDYSEAESMQTQVLQSSDRKRPYHHISPQRNTRPYLLGEKKIDIKRRRVDDHSRSRSIEKYNKNKGSRSPDKLQSHSPHRRRSPSPYRRRARSPNRRRSRSPFRNVLRSPYNKSRSPQTCRSHSPYRNVEGRRYQSNTFNFKNNRRDTYVSNEHREETNKINSRNNDNKNYSDGKDLRRTLNEKHEKKNSENASDKKDSIVKKIYPVDQDDKMSEIDICLQVDKHFTETQTSGDNISIQSSHKDTLAPEIDHNVIDCLNEDKNLANKKCTNNKEDSYEIEDGEIEFEVGQNLGIKKELKSPDKSGQNDKHSNSNISHSDFSACSTNISDKMLQKPNISDKNIPSSTITTSARQIIRKHRKIEFSFTEISLENRSSKSSHKSEGNVSIKRSHKKSNDSTSEKNSKKKYKESTLNKDSQTKVQKSNSTDNTCKINQITSDKSDFDKKNIKTNSESNFSKNSSKSTQESTSDKISQKNIDIVASNKGSKEKSKKDTIFDKTSHKTQDNIDKNSHIVKEECASEKSLHLKIPDDSSDINSQKPNKEVTSDKISHKKSQTLDKGSQISNEDKISEKKSHRKTQEVDKNSHKTNNEHCSDKHSQKKSKNGASNKDVTNVEPDKKSNECKDGVYSKNTQKHAHNSSSEKRLSNKTHDSGYCKVLNKMGNECSFEKSSQKKLFESADLLKNQKEEKCPQKKLELASDITTEEKISEKKSHKKHLDSAGEKKAQRKVDKATNKSIINEPYATAKLCSNDEIASLSKDGKDLIENSVSLIGSCESNNKNVQNREYNNSQEHKTGVTEEENSEGLEKSMTANAVNANLSQKVLTDEHKKETCSDSKSQTHEDVHNKNKFNDLFGSETEFKEEKEIHKDISKQCTSKVKVQGSKKLVKSIDLEAKESSSNSNVSKKTNEVLEADKSNIVKTDSKCNSDSNVHPPKPEISSNTIHMKIARRKTIIRK